MKQILTEESFEVPSKVEVAIKAKHVEVKGPLGVLKRRFNKAHLDIKKVVDSKKRTKVVLQMWQAGRRERCVVNSIATQIKNMIRGVTRGYKFKMVFAHAHFPIIANVIDKGAAVEIKNFLGEKIVRTIVCKPGTIVSRTEEEKNMLTVQGNDLNNVSLTCALIHQSCQVKEKDIRQFLDGIYVSEKRLDITV